jgi:L-methionine (R)-S-oxide reductase
MSSSIHLEQWLQQFLGQHQGTAGTIHLVENGGLKLAAAINIPPPVQQIVAWVPKGKGMAGLAFERNEPVHTCNLKEDTSGNVKPGARAVNAQAAVAVPVTDQTGSVFAVVGIAFSNEREFTQPELNDLMTSAFTIRTATSV